VAVWPQTGEGKRCKLEPGRGSGVITGTRGDAARTDSERTVTVAPSKSPIGCNGRGAPVVTGASLTSRKRRAAPVRLVTLVVTNAAASARRTSACASGGKFQCLGPIARWSYQPARF
jgi:hypothetical protein